jgi:peptidoglycan/LPS O-acetylase OafA/YrhL
LCIEEQFYMLLPAVALGIAALRRSLVWAWVAIVAVLVGGCVARYLLWHEYVGGSSGSAVDYYRHIYYSTFCRFDELVAGVALALVKNYHAPAWQKMTAQGNLSLVSGCIVSAVAFWLFLDNRQGLFITVTGFPLLALGFSLLIVAALSDTGALRGARIPGAASLALWSYAIYLSHKQLCILASEPLRRLGYGPDSAIAIAAMLALSVFAGWLLYLCVETPFMKLRERYVPTNFAPKGV